MADRDPRLARLIEASRKVVAQSNYDPHFSGLEERVIMESQLWLARLDALTGTGINHLEKLALCITPVPMILFCPGPGCGKQHVDTPEPPKWTNPPHKSHLCAYCGHIWRPADVPTTGVATINTLGQRDSQPPIRGAAR